MKRKILFIVNPISGIGKQKNIEELIEKHIDSSTIDYVIRYSEYPHHSKEIAYQASHSGDCDILVAVGGDGTINDVCNGMIDTDTTLGIVPCGSGNGLARHLKISTNPATAIETLNGMKTEKTDVLYINDRLVVSIAGIGFDARVAHHMKILKHRGLKSYINIVVNEYNTYKSHDYKLIIDGQEIERNAWFISFANANQFGYNTMIAPQASINDGLMDVCIVDKIPLYDIPFTAPLLYLNHFELSHHVEYFKAKEVTVQGNVDRWVNIDGEAEKLGNDLHIKVRNRALELIVP